MMNDERQEGNVDVPAAAATLSWSPIPRHRHLSTVGIGPVFLRPPPPPPQPPQPSLAVASEYAEPHDPISTEGNDRAPREGRDDAFHGNEQIEVVSSLTWEIVGAIKSFPEDFVVREVGFDPSPPSSSSPSRSSSTADLPVGSSDVGYSPKKRDAEEGKGTKTRRIVADFGMRWEREEESKAVNQASGGAVEASLHPAPVASLPMQQTKTEPSDPLEQSRTGRCSGDGGTGMTTESISHPSLPADAASVNDFSYVKVEHLCTSKGTEGNGDNEILKKNDSINNEEMNDEHGNPGKVGTTKEDEDVTSPSVSSACGVSSNNPPIDGLRRIFAHCSHKYLLQESSQESELSNSDSRHKPADAIMERLATLQASAEEEIVLAATAGLATDRERKTTNIKSSPEACLPLGNGDEGDAPSKDCGADKSVWIFVEPLLAQHGAGSDWKMLHKFIRVLFPCLKTEVLAWNPSIDGARTSPADAGEGKDGVTGEAEEGKLHTAADADGQKPTARPFTTNKKVLNEKRWVKVCVDRTFFGIASYLARPREDLIALHRYQNNGSGACCSSATNACLSAKEYVGARKTDRRSGRGRNGRDFRDDHDDAGCNGCEVMLQLKPDLPRCERRNVHRLFSCNRWGLDTSTRNDVPLGADVAEEGRNAENDLTRAGDEKSDKGATSLPLSGRPSEYSANVVTTTAIVVRWSHRAKNNEKRKRDHDESKHNERKGNKRERRKIIATFCVLKKKQVEHQVAINLLANALKCRPGNIGLAGIKDMQAVTYQFCTLRDVDLHRAQRAISFLKRNRVELGSFRVVHDFLLNRGDLVGNRFNIIIRKLRRVERRMSNSDDKDGRFHERMVPCDASHLHAMVDRVRDSGFINFYGQQRVGDAGSESEVGVRSFDIGRAMLLRDFAGAIDLMMTGRSSAVYSPGEEEQMAREIWKTSGGDPTATLKAFPKNRNTMVRERAVMQGLKRHGDALEAIRCVQFNVRLFWIHAYQAYVWNKVATERIRLGASRPMIGDLFMVPENEGDAVQIVCDPTGVSIDQIVLPLPGYNIQYPTNEIGQLYKHILDGDGVQFQKGDIPEATAKGSYRKLFQQARDVKLEIVQEGVSCVDAAKLSFELNSGSYATMFLRELMVSTMARDSKVRSNPSN